MFIFKNIKSQNATSAGNKKAWGGSFCFLCTKILIIIISKDIFIISK